MATAKKWVVTATRLYTLVDGKRTRFFRGEEVSGLSDADIERYTAAGAIAPASDAAAKDALATPTGPHPAEVAASEPAVPVPPHEASDIVAAANSQPVVVRPAKAATREVWANYAVRSGQLTDDEVKGKTRDELRDTLK